MDNVIELPNARNEVVPIPVDRSPAQPPPVDNAHVAPGCQPFDAPTGEVPRPPAPSVFCVVAPGGAGCLMTPLGPLLTIDFGAASTLATQNGGEVMEWHEAYHLLRAHAKNTPPPSILLDASGRPANAEKKLIT